MLLSQQPTLLPPSKVYYKVVNFYFSRLAFFCVASQLGFRKERTLRGTDWNLMTRHSMGTDFGEWYCSSYTTVIFTIFQEKRAKNMVDDKTLLTLQHRREWWAPFSLPLTFHKGFVGNRKTHLCLCYNDKAGRPPKGAKCASFVLSV